MNNKGTRQALLGILILACGVVIGAGGALIALRDQPGQEMEKSKLEWLKKTKKAPAPETAWGDLMRALKEKLDLSEKQATATWPILKKRMATMGEVKKSNWTALIKQVRLMEKEVAAQLNESQAAAWEKHCERYYKTTSAVATKTKEKILDSKIEEK